MWILINGFFCLAENLFLKAAHFRGNALQHNLSIMNSILINPIHHFKVLTRSLTLQNNNDSKILWTLIYRFREARYQFLLITHVRRITQTISTVLCNLINREACQAPNLLPITNHIPSLQWRQNERDGVSNQQPRDCLLSRLIRHRSTKTSKLRVTGLCVGNSSGTGEFPAQMASNVEYVSIWWRHYVSEFSWLFHREWYKLMMMMMMMIMIMIMIMILIIW